MRSILSQRPWVIRYWQALVGLGFRLLYNEFAWTYDAVSWLVSLGQWRAWQRAGLQFLNGSRVLELAHGPGHMLTELEAKGFHPTGIDLSSNMGRMAFRKLRNESSYVALVRSQAQALPFQDAAFDCMLATFPTEFIVDPATIAEIFRALKPDGRLVIVAEAQLTGGGLLKVFLEGLYAITGQRQVSHESHEEASLWTKSRERYRAVGFNIWLESVVLEGSLVRVAIAEKKRFRTMSVVASNC